MQYDGRHNNKQIGIIKMWTVLRSEIIYIKKFSVITYVLPLIYIALLVYGIRYDDNLYDYYRIAGTLIFGMIPVILVATAFTASLKEKRTRLQCLLPLRSMKIGSARILYFIFPIIYLNLLGITALLISGNGWDLISNKIVYEYGAMSMILSGLYIAYEFFIVSEINSDLSKLLLGGVFLIILLAVLFKVDNLLWNEVPQAYIGWLYTSISITVLPAGYFLFIRRKNFLD